MNWTDYWARATCSGNRSSPQYLVMHSAELRLLFPTDPSPRTVLDVGCGDGFLYEALGFDKLEYRGIDFSSSMLDCFRSRYSNVQLHCADAAEYRDGRKYDLIFSCGMAQYLNRNQLRRFFLNVRGMMHERSAFVLASTPCRQHRAGYMRGVLAPPYRATLRHSAYRLCNAILRRDPLGYWYNPGDLMALAHDTDLHGQVYGSQQFLYRIHSVFQQGAARSS